MQNRSFNVIRCKRCTLPEVFPNIKYDSEGICSICHEWDQKWGKARIDEGKKPEEKLTQLIKSLKKRKGKYDCVVGFSGGKDSVYTLYLLKNKYNLNPLALNVVNGFQNEEIKKWIPNITKKLGVDLKIYEINLDYFYKLMKKAFLKTGYLCLWCQAAVFSALQKVANENNVSVVFLGGGSKIEINIISKHHELDYYNYVKSIFKDDSSIDWSDYYIDKRLCDKIKTIWLGGLYSMETQRFH